MRKVMVCSFWVALRRLSPHSFLLLLNLWATHYAQPSWLYAQALGFKLTVTVEFNCWILFFCSPRGLREYWITGAIHRRLVCVWWCHCNVDISWGGHWDRIVWPNFWECRAIAIDEIIKCTKWQLDCTTGMQTSIRRNWMVIDPHVWQFSKHRKSTM
jgi:hypothetical protein